MLNSKHGIFIDNQQLYIVVFQVHLIFSLVDYFSLHCYGVKFITPQ